MLISAKNGVACLNFGFLKNTLFEIFGFFLKNFDFAITFVPIEIQK
jgi:hypothetical protein